MVGAWNKVAMSVARSGYINFIGRTDMAYGLYVEREKEGEQRHLLGFWTEKLGRG